MAAVVDMPHKDVPPPLELVKSRITELMPPEAKERIDAGDPVVVDVRNPERFEKGHLEGSTNLSSGESGGDAREDSYAKAIEEAAGGRDKELILVCGEGNRSARTADWLHNQHGFEKVSSVVGGIKLWSDLGYPVEGEITAGADDAELGEGFEEEKT